MSNILPEHTIFLEQRMTAAHVGQTRFLSAPVFRASNLTAIDDFYTM